MDMQFTISAQDLTGCLKVAVSGGRIEFSGFTHGMKVVIEEDSGMATIGFVSYEDLNPTSELVAVEVQSDEVGELTDEAVMAVEAVSDKPGIVSDTPNYLLFQQLAGLRRQIASEVKLPAYMIFHDRTLQEMCRLLPVELEALGSISGVGSSKLEKYGSRFIEVIGEYVCGMQEYAED